MRLEKKVAIITGAGSGFGEGLAHRFAREGASVVVNDISADAAKRVAESIRSQGGSASAHTADVASASDVNQLVQRTLADYKHIDIIVNNAGITHRNKPLLDVDEKTYDRVFNVNVKACYLSAMSLIPVFRQQGSGVFLNIASVAGIRPRPGLTWYCASKGAIIAMTKAMAIELAPDSIRVNAICPVAGDTPLLSRFMPEDTAENRETMVSSIPLGRLAKPEDVANAALFMVSDEASLITGSILEVDGGRSV